MRLLRLCRRGCLGRVCYLVVVVFSCCSARFCRMSGSPCILSWYRRLSGSAFPCSHVSHSSIIFSRLGFGFCILLFYFVYVFLSNVFVGPAYACVVGVVVFPHVFVFDICAEFAVFAGGFPEW